MPTICRFYGILIQMYYDDHNPPHFHAIYGSSKAVIAIQDLAILGGDLPPKAVGRDWQTCQISFHGKSGGLNLSAWEYSEEFR